VKIIYLIIISLKINTVKRRIRKKVEVERIRVEKEIRIIMIIKKKEINLHQDLIQILK